MTDKTELGVWGFEHFTVYLCALVERLHPTEPVGQLADILAEARARVRDRRPFDLTHLRIDDPPSDFERWNAIEEVAHQIIEVVNFWAAEPELQEHYGVPAEDWDRYEYDSARSAARYAEEVALRYLDYDDLAECAVLAFFELQPGPDERDAAVAAMTVGHYDIALDIITRKR